MACRGPPVYKLIIKLSDRSAPVGSTAYLGKAINHNQIVIDIMAIPLLCVPVERNLHIIVVVFVVVVDRRSGKMYAM